jgi:hypothetical protein
MKIDSGWIWLGGVGILVFHLGLQVFGASPEQVEAAWRAAVVFMLAALGQQIKEGQKKP